MASSSSKAKGFYSIIQFVPDLDRCEGANVGVVLAVPPLGYVGVRLSQDNAAPRRFFGPDAIDTGRLDVAKSGIKSRILCEGVHWTSAEDLVHFSNCEGNHLGLVPPRTILTEDPEADLERLYLRLVESDNPRRILSQPADRISTMTPLSFEAKAALAPPGRTLDDPELVARDGPGLYAIYGSPDVWQQLGLGPPPDDRPLYVGKAEESVIRRDVRQHFRTGKTGSSTVRRSLAAFLRRSLHLKAQPRNPAKPDHFSSYSVDKDGDARLTEWMRKNLRLALWLRPNDDELRPIESALLQHWQPPLNGQGVKTPYSGMVSAVRKSMADEARAWKA